MSAEYLFPEYEDGPGNQYSRTLTASENMKGVMDVDTVKGCRCGMAAHPSGGCYGECYALKSATRFARDFATAVSRVLTPSTRADIFCTVRDHSANWYRVGVSGDPCHDWDNTADVCEYLEGTGTRPVIITKHWIPLLLEHVMRFAKISAVFNTSVSGIDSDAQMNHRVKQMMRLREHGIVSACRVVTCRFGDTEWGNAARKKQDYLLSLGQIIDTPLRATSTNPRVISGDILIEKVEGATGWKHISLHRSDVYLASCDKCPDQCGVPQKQHRNTEQT